MRKVLFAVMLLLGMSIFYSCNGNGLSSGGIKSTIVGDWVYIEDNDPEGLRIGSYISFTKDGKYTLYELCYEGDYDKYATIFDNGTIYAKPSVYWEKEGVAEYSIEGNDLFVAGILIGSIKKVNNDKFIFTGFDEDFMGDGTLERIKSFKTDDNVRKRYYPGVSEVWVADQVYVSITKWGFISTHRYVDKEDWNNYADNEIIQTPYAYVFYNNHRYSEILDYDELKNSIEDIEEAYFSNPFEFFNIDDSYVYTTWNDGRSDNPKEFKPMYKIISKTDKTIDVEFVLQPVLAYITDDLDEYKYLVRFIKVKGDDYKSALNPGQGDSGSILNPTTNNKRIKMCGDEWDKYVFTYGNDGKIANVTRNEGEITWDFTWTGNVGTAKYVKDGESRGNWVFTLGSNGYLSTFANHWGDTWTFAYNAEGYLTSIKRQYDGKTVAKCVWTNGDLTKWSRLKDNGAEEWKTQCFLAADNLGGIFPDASDKADIDRWIFELGYCGKPSAHLLDQASWESSDAISVYAYDIDAEGYVTKVTKVYDMGDPEYYFYAWEVVD